ncbi:MAG TPA: hypothetical protein VGJ28_18430 [Micromonosporaceae bacterium]|jgi:hypothetical protein
MSNDVRELFARHEHDIDGAAGRLLSGVAARQRRRGLQRRIGYAATAAGVVAALAGSYVVVHGTGPATPIGRGSTPAPARMPVSSRGIQITVPSTWVYNDIGCRADNRPTIVTGDVAMPLCFTPTAPDKQYAYIEPATVDPLAVAGSGAKALIGRPTTLDGAAAVRALGPVTDGMWAGWIRVPSRNVEVVVRDRSESAVAATLDSARLVGVDGNGCPTHPPAHPTGGRTDRVVDPAPISIVVCDYGEDVGGAPPAPVLIASAVQRGADVLALARTLNEAAPGHNRPLPSAECAPTENPPVNAYLFVHQRDGGLATVAITIMACSQRGIDDGVSVHQISVQLILQMSLHLNGGWAYQMPL